MDYFGWIIPPTFNLVSSAGEPLRQLLTGMALELFRWYLANRNKMPWLDRYVVTVVLMWLFLWFTVAPAAPMAC